MNNIVKTKALRLHDAGKISVDTFDLPPIKDDEILAKIVCDSLCMSSYKAAIQGSAHKRVPDDLENHPIILGHECCGEIVEVGSEWKSKYAPGDRFALQPQVVYKGCIDGPGYSWEYMGGDATYVVVPFPVMAMDCLIPYNADAFFYGSLAEPYSCVIGSFDEMFHTKPADHNHYMGNKPGGDMAILAGAGPMGFAAIDYIIHCDRRPKRLVVTDIDGQKLERQKNLINTSNTDVKVTFVKTGSDNDIKLLKNIIDGKGFDEVLVMAPVSSLIECADKLLCDNGYLSFFAGPSDQTLSAPVNFYAVHYNATHIGGSIGGNVADMKKAITMMEQKKLDPASLITHVGGLDSTVETMNLPEMSGAKKLVYTQINLPLTAIDDFEAKGKTEPLFADLAEIVKSAGGKWCPEAEKFLLKNAKASY